MFTDPPPPAGAPEGCWFDRAAADAACAFFPRYLRHTEGEWAGRPFELAPWQAERIVRPLFGWKRADGTRLYRVAYIEIPRKNGKTELAAGLALLLLLGDGEFGGQVYALAVDKDQAKIVFNKAGVMVGFSETLARDLEVLKTSIFCAELHASFKPLSSGAESKHGFSPSGAVGDELHAWPNGELQDVVHKGTAARRQPLEIYITTAGLHGVGFGWEMHQRAAAIRDGELADPEFLPVIYAADEDDDWTDEATWRKANPNYGVSVKPEYMAAECRKAQESPRKENDFKRYHLDLWTEQVIRWLAMADWDACAGPLPWRQLEAYLAGRDCYAGLDLSSKIDLAGFVNVFPPVEAEEPWFLLPRLFVPERQAGIEPGRPRSEDTRAKLLHQWAEAGALTLTAGNVVDYDFIEAALIADASRFRIVECAFDPWNATQFATHMGDEGMTMVEFRQGYGSMSEPAKELERLVIDHAVAHGGHPVLRWMAKNVAIRKDPAGNIKPDKEKAGENIDGIVGAVMGLGRAITAEPPGEDLNDAILRRGLVAVG